MQNWSNEFNHWTPSNDPNTEYQRSFSLYILNETSKKFTQRARIVQNWLQTGGTLIIGYEMFRLLVTKKQSYVNASMKSNGGNKSISSRSATPIVVDLEEEEKNFETMEGKIRLALIGNPCVSWMCSF